MNSEEKKKCNKKIKRIKKKNDFQTFLFSFSSPKKKIKKVSERKGGKPSPMRQLSDPPSIHEVVKTTIVNGVIVRKTVWRDTLGHEFEKVDNKLVPIFPQKNHRGPKGSPPPLSLMPFGPPHFNPFHSVAADPIEWHISYPDHTDDFFMLFCFMCLLFLTFLVGFAAGSVRTSRRYKKIKTRKEEVTTTPQAVF